VIVTLSMEREALARILEEGGTLTIATDSREGVARFDAVFHRMGEPDDNTPWSSTLKKLELDGFVATRRYPDEHELVDEDGVQREILRTRQDWMLTDKGRERAEMLEVHANA
jgi:tRNA G46 methylase TrmB